METSKKSASPYTPISSRGSNLANSNHWQNLPLRREYRQENPWCELAPYFPERFENANIIPFPEFGLIISKRYTSATEVHHITGGLLGTPRYDIWPNLIALSRPVHAWCERYTKDGLALCCLAKLRKRPMEFDSVKLNEITRVCFVAWIEQLDCKFDIGREAQRLFLREFASMNGAT